jgi:hypothetical protein
LTTPLSGKPFERKPESDWDLTRKRFVYGLVLAGVSLWRQFEEREEDRDEIVRESTAALARVLLPVISVLGALEEGLAAR